MGLEIEKTLVVSTAHMSRQDYVLSRITSSLVVYVQVEFYVIPLDQELDSRFSSSFRDLFNWAKAHEEQFTHLKLDRDGPQLEGFETFDW